MGREVLKEEIDYTIFADEPQFYLAQIRGGCPGGEDEAFALTVHNYAGRVTADDVRSWARDPAFQRALKHAREMGEENREYDTRKAARRSDPFATPPRPGQVDLAAESYDASTPKPPGALSRFLRRLGIEIDWQHAQREEPRPSGQRTIPQDEMTDRDWAGVRYQGAELLQRAQAEHAAEDQPWGAPQEWDRKREWISPDGSEWQGAPVQSGRLFQSGGLFSSQPDPSSFPMP